MKKEEQKAEKYFKNLGFKNIDYEPKGNRTPDFVINDEIAVEVRRLNQFLDGEPLEKVYFKIVPKILNLIENYNTDTHTKSSFVSIHFSRPSIVNKKDIKLINEILDFHSNKMEQKKRYKVGAGLELEFHPSEKKLEKQYWIGGIVDFDEGGFILSNIYKSLKLISPAKYNIIQPYKSEYPIWWLALIDHISFSPLTKNELNILKQSIDFNLKFDKVILISNSNPMIGSEL
ncbi:hypothetical protein [Christiangramia sp.]|uniref:hypothetical protein n=1 Tax=Christiangramia sp. TaxID=1931228 RepID=UPI00261F9AAE|nr:hypothetical protein [Christiangramia sp.]